MPSLLYLFQSNTKPEKSILPWLSFVVTLSPYPKRHTTSTSTSFVMRTTLAAASLLALASAVEAAKGFNYGSTFTTGAAKVQSDFEAEFKTAAGLEGTNGFTSARLYTMIVRCWSIPLL